MTHPDYDLILFGATAFVGRLVACHLARRHGTSGAVRWAIAGRNQARLEALRSELPLTQPDQLAIMVADATDVDGLKILCRQTRVVISCVGPYALYGESLVRACAETGTDYCDLSGEPQWMQRMQENYGQQAIVSGARIVHACGFDSLPSDMGVWYLQQLAIQRFGSACSQVEMRLKGGKGGFSGGTIASLLNVLADAEASPAVARQLQDPYSLCPPGHGFSASQPNVAGAVLHRASGLWSMPFIMAPINTRVVHKTNALRNGEYGKQFLYDEAVLTGPGTPGKWITAMISGGFGLFLKLLGHGASREFLARHWLAKPGSGPSAQQQQEGFFDLHFYGYNADGLCLAVRVTGDQDPGYGSTSRMLAETALCLAQEFWHNNAKSGAAGGFWTTASLFDERLLTRLREHAGMTFEELSIKK